MKIKCPKEISQAEFLRRDKTLYMRFLDNGQFSEKTKERMSIKEIIEYLSSGDEIPHLDIARCHIKVSEYCIVKLYFDYGVIPETRTIPEYPESWRWFDHIGINDYERSRVPGQKYLYNGKAKGAINVFMCRNGHEHLIAQIPRPALYIKYGFLAGPNQYAEPSNSSWKEPFEWKEVPFNYIKWLYEHPHKMPQEVRAFLKANMQRRWW